MNVKTCVILIIVLQLATLIVAALCLQRLRAADPHGVADAEINTLLSQGFKNAASLREAMEQQKKHQEMLRSRLSEQQADTPPGYSEKLALEYLGLVSEIRELEGDWDIDKAKALQNRLLEFKKRNPHFESVAVDHRLSWIERLIGEEAAR